MSKFVAVKSGLRFDDEARARYVVDNTGESIYQWSGLYRAANFMMLGAPFILFLVWVLSLELGNNFWVTGGVIICLWLVSVAVKAVIRYKVQADAVQVAEALNIACGDVVVRVADIDKLMVRNIYDQVRLLSGDVLWRTADSVILDYERL